jgi:hypothetical protein
MESKAFAWSYSALKNFETCPKKYYHASVAKDVVEAPSDEVTSGYAMHTALEARIKHGTTLPLGYTQYEPMMAAYVAAPGVTYAEQKLALTPEFRPATYFAKDVWFRTVLDTAKVRPDEGFALVVDWKSGKPKDDTTQLDLMAATMFLHDPRLVKVKASLAFLAHKVWVPETYVRQDVRRIWSDILPRVAALKQARAKGEYPAKPSGLCRRYCAVRACAYNGR